MASLMMAQPEVDSAVGLLTSEECLLTLTKVLDNILTETAYEKKTRKLKLTNETFSRRVARHPGGVDFLLGCNFTRKNQTLVLKRDNEDKLWLWNARNALHQRSLVLGFVLSPMPPAPSQKHVTEGRKYSASASLYETSTIGTLEELESEIMRELEDDDGFSLDSPAGGKASNELHIVSPLGTAILSTTDRLLGKPGLNQISVLVPELPAAKSVESPTRAALKTTMPTLPPRPSAKSPSSEAKAVSPARAQTPSSPKAQSLLKVQATLLVKGKHPIVTQPPTLIKSPVKSQAPLIPKSSIQTDTTTQIKLQSPRKLEVSSLQVPRSLFKNQVASSLKAQSPTKVNSLLVPKSPIKNQSASPLKTQPPVKSEANSLLIPRSPIKTQPASSIKTQPPVKSKTTSPLIPQSPIKAQATSQLKVQLPVKAKVASRLIPLSPVKTQAISPLKVQSPAKAKAASLVVPQSLVKSQAASPIKSQAPVKTTTASLLVPQSPAKTQPAAKSKEASLLTPQPPIKAKVVSPLKVQPPMKSEAASPLVLKSPINTQAASPIISQHPKKSEAFSPLTRKTPVKTQALTRLDTQSPATSRTPPPLVSNAPIKTELVSPIESQPLAKSNVASSLVPRSTIKTQAASPIKSQYPTKLQAPRALKSHPKKAQLSVPVKLQSSIKTQELTPSKMQSPIKAKSPIKAQALTPAIDQASIKAQVIASIKPQPSINAPAPLPIKAQVIAPAKAQISSPIQSQTPPKCQIPTSAKVQTPVPVKPQVAPKLRPPTRMKSKVPIKAKAVHSITKPVAKKTNLVVAIKDFPPSKEAEKGLELNSKPELSVEDELLKEMEAELDDGSDDKIGLQVDQNLAIKQQQHQQAIKKTVENNVPEIQNGRKDVLNSASLSPTLVVEAQKSVGCSDVRVGESVLRDKKADLQSDSCMPVENKGYLVKTTEKPAVAMITPPLANPVSVLGPPRTHEKELEIKMKEAFPRSNDRAVEKESIELLDDSESETDALLEIAVPVEKPTPPQTDFDLLDGLSAPSTFHASKQIDSLEQEMFAFLQEEQPRSKFNEEISDVFSSSTSSLGFKTVDDCEGSNPRGDNAFHSVDHTQTVVNIKPPPVSKSHDGLKEFFDGSEPTSASSSMHDSDEEVPLRTRLPRPVSGDNLEKEMASVLAQSSEILLSQSSEIRVSSAQTTPMPAGDVQELDDGDSMHSGVRQSVSGDTANDRSISDKSIPEQTEEARGVDLDNGTAEDLNYSSGHAHTDWLKLNQLMKNNSLLAEYEMCWGSLCTLSVVCADLATEEFGLSPPSLNQKKSRKNRSKRSWLPLELVQGLWNLVLSTGNSFDSARVTYVCSKLHDVLIDSQHLEILERDENGASLPHSTWVRVKKEKMVLLGFALPISISQQSEWMRKLVKAIADDTQFWYGRYALPTIAIAGGDKQATAKSLLRDVDFVQSRLDVIGIVTGTRRHVLDCKSYIKAKKQAFKDRQFRSEEFTIEIAEETGNDVALDGCQQVAACLYKQGQVFCKSNVSIVHMIELAAALHLIGMAVGEFGDWEMEMQLYQKTIKVLQDCGGYNTECAANTLLSMGDCRLGQGDCRAAMGCYEEAHDIYRSQLGEDSNQVAVALHHMGVIHCETGELQTAMEAFKTSLKLKQDNGMTTDYDEETADTLCWIGRVYREQGLPEKARKYFDTARDVKGDFCGADSLEVAEILHNIAVLYDDSGDFERSLRYYRKSLKIRRAALGDQHEDVCDIIACIGNVYKSMGDDRTALKVFRHANELRSSVTNTTILNKQQTKILISSYEDILDILRIQYKSSETPAVEQDEIASILLKMGQLYDTDENFGKSDRCFEKSLKLMLSSGDQIKAGQVLNVKGISFAKRQKYIDAMTAFEQALVLRKEALGVGHIDVAETLHNMGNCAAKAGDLNDARTYYDEALRIKRQRLGSNNTSVAQTLHNIGNVLIGQGKNDAAMNSYQEALTLRRGVLGNDNIEVAYSLHCIAKINRKQHDIEAARENFSAALRIKRHKLRKNHPSVAETLEQLGSLYMEIGEEDEATLCLNGALNIYKSKHGEGVKVAHVYEQLGGKCERQQNPSKAIVYFHKSLRVRARVFGGDHVSIADMHYRIGKLQRDQGSFFEALASFQAATKIRKQIVGRDDLIISDVLTDAGKLQMKLGQAEIADKCFGEALRIRSLILDPRHEKIGECLLLNGRVLVEGGQYQEAVEIFREALSIFQDNTGEYGLSCADAYHQLGTVFKIKQDYDKAQESYEKCLKTWRASNADENLDVAKVNHGLGEVYFARGDFRRAEEYFRDSVEVLVNHLGEDHMDVANAVLSLGRTCTKLNSPDEATMYFEQAKLTKQHHLGDSHLEVLEISLEIGRAHAMKKEYDDALQCFQAYLRARRSAVGDDTLVCDILHEVGTVEYEMKHYDEALKSFASALALYRVLLGDEHIQVATTLYSLGVAYEAKRGFKESMKYHKEAFRLRRRLLGADHLDVANSLDKISGLYLKQPNLEKALHSMKEVLRIRTHALGTDHVDVGSSLYGMGVIFSESNELEKSLECYAVSLKIRAAHFGEASVEAAQALHNMGTVLAKQQDFSSALEHWRRALVAYREAGLSDEDHLVAITIGNVNMAEAYLDDEGTQKANNTEVRVN